jgi:hypothetical protein
LAVSIIFGRGGVGFGELRRKLEEDRPKFEPDPFQTGIRSFKNTYVMMF